MDFRMKNCSDNRRNKRKRNDEDKVKESPKSDFPAPSFLKDAKNRRHVSRPREVVDARNDVPIVMMEQEIMEAINENPTVIIRGETGCGKTTQVPQFLYEVGIGSSGCPLGSGIIGVTQPRCIAVTATAKRVAYELGLQLGKEVGFQYRYDKKIGQSCSIKFMTDGILLREIQGDFSLKRYSVIILDEVHERSLYIEILIGMLSAIVGIRQKLYEDQQKALHLGISIVPEKRIFPLKLLLMSATMPVADFKRLFPDPPQVINVLSRQFKVNTHFSATTEGDYSHEAYKKVLEIHKTLPHGGILVFVTGCWEVEVLCQKLRRASRKLTMKTSIGICATEGHEINSVEEINMKKNSEAFDGHGNSAFHQTDRFSYNDEDQCEIDEYELDSSYDAETESELETIGDEWDSLCEGTPSSLACKQPISCTLDSCSNQPNHSCNLGKKSGVEDGSFPGSLRVLPLYSTLPAAAQRRVFEKVKEGERLVVVATNVAETSLTIPGIKYVVDTGKVKVKDYNCSNGMATYKVQWISKASAIQREGRAGRTGPGHCFRLYSSVVFDNEFLDRSEAEISRVPVDGVLLFMKSMQIPVSNFRFPTLPNGDTIDGAVERLKFLKALEMNEEVTPLGKAMACYPISPRHSKMLVTVIQILNKKSYSQANLVLAYAVAAAAALSLSNPFLSQFEDSHTQKHDLDQDGNSSALVNSEVIDQQEIHIRRKYSTYQKELKVSCENFHCPSSDAVSRAYALRCYEISNTSRLLFCKYNALHLETMEEMSKLRKQLLNLVFSQSGVSGGEKEFSWIHGSLKDVEHVWRSDRKPPSVHEEELLSQAICAGWIDRVAKRIEGSAYQACMVKETVFLHRQSSVSKVAPKFLVYSELIQTKKPYMYSVTSVKPEWLVEYGRSLCTFSKETAPYYDRLTDKLLYNVTPIFGRVHSWELPQGALPVGNYKFEGAVQAFAFALLYGKVLHCLRPVREFMAEHPRTVLKPEAADRKRVTNIFLKLKNKRINSCATLREVWKENPYELYPEIQDWFQKSFHKKFEELWFKMLHEVVNK